MPWASRVPSETGERPASEFCAEPEQVRARLPLRKCRENNASRTARHERDWASLRRAQQDALGASLVLRMLAGVTGALLVDEAGLGQRAPLEQAVGGVELRVVVRLDLGRFGGRERLDLPGLAHEHDAVRR